VPTAVALRPRSFSELIDAAFLLAREHFRPLATLSAIVAIPAIVLGVVNVALFGPTTTDAPGAAALARTLPVALVTMCWYFVGIGALVHAASNAYLGEPIDPAESLRRALGRAGALIAAHAVAYLAALATLLAAAIVAALAGAAAVAAGSALGMRAPSPGPAGVALVLVLGAAALGVVALVFARYANVTPAVMLESSAAIPALRRSAALAAGHVGRIVGLLVVLATLSLVFSLSALALGSLARNEYVSTVVATLFSIPLYPLASCALTALYYDLRIRKEGFDIAWDARGIGGPPGAAA
jgi:hypothetical protein